MFKTDVVIRELVVIVEKIEPELMSGTDRSPTESKLREVIGSQRL